jgi:hypothetical protein
MATSKLQIEVGDLLDKELPEYRIRENFRPDWLISSEKTRLELDFFIEELKIGIEVQGAQHYQFIPFFHKDEQDYLRRTKLDKEKRELCEAVGIKFWEVFTLTDAIIIIKEIQESAAPLDKYNYSDCSRSVLAARMLKRFKKKTILLKKRDILPA